MGFDRRPSVKQQLRVYSRQSSISAIIGSEDEDDDEHDEEDERSGHVIGHFNFVGRMGHWALVCLWRSCHMRSVGLR